MRVIRFDDRDECLRRVMPFLMTAEAVNCFFLGFIPAQPTRPDSILLAAENDAGEVTAVAIKSPTHHLALTDAPPGAIDALANYFADEKIPLPGVQSRRHAAQRFADVYCARTGAA